VELAGARVLTHFANLLAITLAAMNSFRFLFYSILMLMGETVGLVIFHDTLNKVITVVFIYQLLSLIGMIVIVLCEVANRNRTVTNGFENT
jgi:hypothetical protein